MTFEQFLGGVLYLFPNAIVASDDTGELTIATGLMFAEDGSGTIVPMTPDGELDD